MHSRCTESAIVGRIFNARPLPNFPAITAVLWILTISGPALAQSMALPGKFAVNGTGAATYSVPIAVPPGTAGLSPVLSLDYNSQLGNGLIGLGWSMSGLSMVARCPRTLAQDGVRGAVNYDANDRFCLDGQRLIAINGGTYGADGTEYRSEIESYTRVISHGSAGTGPAWFEVHTKAGQGLEFGHTANAQLVAPSTGTVRSWGVNKVSDSKGNYYTVSYTNDAANGQLYPNEVDYTGNASANVAPYNKVQLIYETRPDIVPQYQAGLLIKATVRLTNIKAYAGTTLVNDYRLIYAQSNATNRSRLTSVTVCEGAGTCLPATTFAWNDGDGVQLSAPVSWSTPGNWSGWTVKTGDVNGDGRLDLIAYAVNSTSWRANVALSQGNGAFAAPVVFQTTGNFSGWSVTTGDVNGDGRSDLITYTTADKISWRANVALSLGDGTYASPLAWSAPGNFSGWTITTGDVNGDGQLDLIAYIADGTSWRAQVALSRGDGTFASPVTWQAAWNFTGWSITTSDVNGDGRLDLIAYYISSFFLAPVAQTQVALSRGDGTFAAPVAWSAPGSWTGWAVTTNDVNGDGQSDLIAYIADSSSWRAQIALSLGDGSFAAPVSWNAAGNWSGWSIATGDVNGDGRSDSIAYAVNTSNWQAKTSLSTQQTSAITAITTGFGVTTTLTYQPLTNASVYIKDNSAAYPQQDLQAPLYAVSRVDTTNGIGGSYSSTYSYAGAKADLSGHGFLGFRQVTTSDLQTNITQKTTYRQDFPYVGLMSAQTKTLGTQTLNQTTNNYTFSNVNGTTSIGPANAPYNILLTQSVQQSADLDGTALPAITTSYQYDTFGNATQVSVSTPDGFSKTTVNTYDNDPMHWYLGRLTRATVTSTTP